MKGKARKYLNAVLPALLLCAPAFASSARSISRFKGKNVAVQSEAAATLKLQVNEKQTADPFAVFGDTAKPAEDQVVAVGPDVLKFLENNNLLRSKTEEASAISGDLGRADFGRKEFAHASAFYHCHSSGGTYNTNTYPTTSSVVCVTAWSGTWHNPAGITPYAPAAFENTSVSNKTATSFDVNVDLNKSSTVYAVLLSSTAPAPSSAQVKAGTDGSGAAAIQAKSQAVTVDPFTGTIPFTGLDLNNNSYLVYLVGDDGTELTATPASVNPAFESGLISSVGTWKFPKVRTDGNGDFHLMYKMDSGAAPNGGIQFAKWNGSSWANYTSLLPASVAGRTYIGYGNEYGGNYGFASNGDMHAIFRASATNMANTSDLFHGVYNGSIWSITQVFNDVDYAQEIRMFIDGNDKVYVVYHVGYTLRYATNASGSWTAQTIVTAGQTIAPGTSSGTDEIHDAFVVADSTGKVTLLYRREYGQNSRQDNYFMATSTDNFAAQTLVLDGKGTAQQFQLGNVIIDGNDKIHYVYANWTNNIGYYRTDASGGWVTTALSSATHTITEGLDIQIDGATTYILTDSNSGYLFQGREGAGSWVDGNPFSLDGWFSDKFGLDTVTNRIMNASENSSDWSISYHTGGISDYVSLGTPNTAPSLGGTFTTNGTVNDNSTTTLFTGVIVADSDGDNVSVAITYTAANGTLSGTGLTGTAGSYTLTSAAPATVQTNLRGLVFQPTANQVAPGNTVGTTFTLTPNDGTANGAADGTTLITATSINDAPVNTVVPAISGTAMVGNPLSGSSGTWADADGDTPGYSYQWYRADDNSGTNETVIALATTNSYPLTTADAHKYLRVIVTADDGNGSNDQTATSVWTAIINTAPNNSALPTISGATTVGGTMLATSGSWADADGDAPTYSHQWYRADDNSGTNETPILLATNNSYTLTFADAHKYLRVIVTADDGNGSNDQTAITVRTAIVNSAPSNINVPVISGTAIVGNPLSCSSGAWLDVDGDIGSFQYQWYRADDNSGLNEAAILLATSNSYPLTSADAHKYLRVIVTVDDGYGSNDQTATSIRTAIINTAPNNSALPTISGATTVGGTMLASTGTWTDADGDAPTYSYQWKSDGANIGTNSSSYILTASEAHTMITVDVTANDGYGGTTMSISAGTLITNTAPTNSTLPMINGTATVGWALSVTTGTWNDNDGDLPTYSYQWQADGADVGITSTYTLTVAEIDKSVTCTVTANDGHGGIVSVTTAGAIVDADIDGDNIGDDTDAFPTDPAASVDSDGDGSPDDWNPGMYSPDSTTGLILDDDDDNDGVADDFDMCAGVDDTIDADLDGIPDSCDDFMTDPAASIDTDSDGLPDDWNQGRGAADSTTGMIVVDDDDDNDGIPDVDDAFPLDPTPIPAGISVPPTATDNGGFERLGHGDKYTNKDYDNGKPRAEVEYLFEIVIKDISANPPASVRLVLNGQVVDMVLTAGNLNDGLLYSLTLKLGPAAVHNFYYEALDNLGNPVYFYPDPGDLAGPVVELLNGPNMLGLAKDMSASGLGLVDLFDSTSIYQWLSAGVTTNINNGSFAALDNSISHVAGQGYFTIRELGASLPDLSVQPETATPTITVDLSPGWNIISNPYGSHIPLSDLLVQRGTESAVSWTAACSNRWLTNSIYSYLGSDWGSSYTFESAGADPEAMLTPWIGYWIYVIQNDADYKLIFTQP